jgi:hypothetical protein
MVTADIMELNPVLIKVVKDSKAEFISLPIVWLRNSTTAKNMCHFKRHLIRKYMLTLLEFK